MEILGIRAVPRALAPWPAVALVMSILVGGCSGTVEPDRRTPPARGGAPSGASSSGASDHAGDLAQQGAGGVGGP